MHKFARRSDHTVAASGGACGDGGVTLSRSWRSGEVPPVAAGFAKRAPAHQGSLPMMVRPATFTGGCHLVCTRAGVTPGTADTIAGRAMLVSLLRDAHRPPPRRYLAASV